jgi:gluconolactonase
VAVAEVLAEGLGFTEGPLALGDGSVWVTSITHGALYRIDPNGKILDKVDTGGGPNGIAMASNGDLYVAQNGGHWGGKEGTRPGIQRVRDGKVEHILSGSGLSIPNDLCFGPDGRLYFTDPRGAAPGREIDQFDASANLPGRLYVCDRDGSNLELLWEEPSLINGLAFGSPHELYVAQTATPHLIHRAEFIDGGLSDFDVFRVLDFVPDGFAVAADGSLWLAATFDNSVQAIDPSGAVIERIDCGPGSTPTNVCFGAGDSNTLFITASERGAVMRVETPATGLPLYG